MVIAAASRPRFCARYTRQALARVRFALFALQLVIGPNATNVHGFQTEALLHPRYSGYRSGELLTSQALAGPRGPEVAAFPKLLLHSSLDNGRCFSSGKRKQARLKFYVMDCALSRNNTRKSNNFARARARASQKEWSALLSKS